jgi:hypothetical protein
MELGLVTRMSPLDSRPALGGQIIPPPPPPSALASYLEYRQRTWPAAINLTCSPAPNG